MPNQTSGTQSKQPKVIDVIYVNNEMALLSKNGKLYFFNYSDSKFKDAIEKDYLNSWNTDTDSGSNDIDKDVMQNFINDYIGDLSVGLGTDGFQEGKDLVELDDEGREWVSSIYKLDKNVQNILNQTNEGVADDFKSGIKKAFNEPSPTNDKSSIADKRAQELARRAKEKQDLQDRHDGKEIDEMTALGGAGGVFQASGYNNFPVAPLGKPIKKKIPTVGESLNEGPVAGGESTGEYTAPAFAMEKNHTDFANITTKAEKVPQWAGGAFVEQPECSKLNNNKEAKNGGCNSGASSLKVKYAKGSVNAPTLARENKIYEEIAAKTGKSVDEIKKIISEKNPKA
jgi:hypothetical protein